MANKLALMRSAGSKITKQVDQEEKLNFDTTVNDDKIIDKSDWIKIGNHEVRTIDRQHKFFIKQPKGSIPIIRSTHSIEVKDRLGSITEYKISQGTGQKEPSFKIINPQTNSVLQKLSEELGLTRNKVISLFNMTIDDINKQINGYSETVTDKDGNETTQFVEPSENLKKLKSLRNHELNKIKSILNIQSMSKSQFIDTLSKRLTISTDDAEKLISGTPEGISQTEKQSEPSLESISAQMEMLEQLKKSISDPNASISDKQEDFNQARGIEMRLQKLGVKIEDPISNYFTPVRTGPSYIAPQKTGGATSRMMSDKEMEKYGISGDTKEPSKIISMADRIKDHLMSRGMSEEEAEKEAENKLKKYNPGVVLFPESKLIKRIENFLAG